MLWGYLSLNRAGPIDTFIRSQYGGHLQYLTIDGLLVSIATLIMSLAADLTGAAGGDSKSFLLY